MSIVNILNVTVLNNPSHFLNPFQFQIQFECLQDLPEDLEWKLCYVGNAESENDDQILEELCVGPVAQGVYMFVFQAPSPRSDVIANKDLIGVTVILLTCSYLDQKFVQIGYYVNNEYAIPFEPEDYPNPVDVSLLTRSILADEPRVTRFAVDWSGQQPIAQNTPLDTMEIKFDAEAAAARDEKDNNNDEDDADQDDSSEDDEEDVSEDDNIEIDIDDDDMDGDNNEGHNSNNEDDEEGEGTSEEEEVNEGVEISIEEDLQNTHPNHLTSNNINNNNSNNSNSKGSNAHHNHSSGHRGGGVVFLNEDSMDVQQMQIEHSSHSHSHSHSLSAFNGGGSAGSGLYY